MICTFLASLTSSDVHFIVVHPFSPKVFWRCWQIFIVHIFVDGTRTELGLFIWFYALQEQVPRELMQVLALETSKADLPLMLALLWWQIWTRYLPRLFPNMNYSGLLCKNKISWSLFKHAATRAAVYSLDLGGFSVPVGQNKSYGGHWVCRGGKGGAQGQPSPGPSVNYIGTSSVCPAYNTNCQFSLQCFLYFRDKSSINLPVTVATISSQVTVTIHSFLKTTPHKHVYLLR